MRVLAISDIHGHNLSFKAALRRVNLCRKDHLILLGDYIDRGPDSKGVLDTILYLMKEGYNVYPLKGNHEQILLDVVEHPYTLGTWLINGGDKTLKSFSTRSYERIPSKYYDFLRSLSFYVQLEKHIFVHASLNMKIDDPFLDIESMLWNRSPELQYDGSWLNDRVLIHGHTPKKRKDITRSIDEEHSIIGIDNGVYLNSGGFGSICVFEIINSSKKVYYANS